MRRRRFATSLRRRFRYVVTFLERTIHAFGGDVVGGGIMREDSTGSVLVQVFPIEPTREIGFGSSLTEPLNKRLTDLRNAIAEGTLTVADSLPGLPSVADWTLSQVTASFGLTLTAEAGVLLSKASAGATFDVAVTFTRADTRESEHLD
jgi:hypothetical protein